VADYSTEQNLRLAKMLLERQGELNRMTARATAAEAALDQLRAYARWCEDRSVEPDERDILNLADGKECHDYVALLRRQGAPKGGED
jgi:hypothetical protein